MTVTVPPDAVEKTIEADRSSEFETPFEVEESVVSPSPSAQNQMDPLDDGPVNQSFAFGEDSDPADPPADFAISETPFLVEGEDEEESDFSAVIPRSDMRSEPEIVFSPKPLFFLLGVMVCGYGFLGYYCFSHVAQAEETLAQFPLLGSLFRTEHASAQDVALTDLTGEFWQTKDNQTVFAISGRAVNNAATSVRSIQVEGKIYNGNGEVVGEREIFCGTETAAAVLRSLTVREISILQNLVPPKQFHVPAGEAVKFLIVFTAPPPQVAELSCRVVAVQYGRSG